MATTFSGGRSRSTRREPPTMDKQLVNFITCGCESTKSGRHDIAEILLKVALSKKKHLKNLYVFQNISVFLSKLTTNPGQATVKLYHLRLRVECTFFLFIYKAEREHTSYW
jgi:hypothetical protein